MKKMTTRLLAILLSGTATAAAQGVIVLKNPSFEIDVVQPGFVPTDWKNAGFLSHTPPDIQPGQFGSDMAAKHGKKYLGMVVRDDGTWEGVGQVLTDKLLKDSAYSFSALLAQSGQYVSGSIRTGREVNYDAPTVLRIFGLNTATGQTEMLAQSQPMHQAVWKVHSFLLRPQTGDYDQINLTAYYARGSEKQNGNLLLDGCSDITPTDGSMAATAGSEWTIMSIPTDATGSKKRMPSASSGSKPEKINLLNPSFELDKAGTATIPRHWYYLGTCATCLPVIEPGVQEKRKKAPHGKNFVALLTVDNGKTEIIGQQLEYPLERDSVYAFTLFASKAERYKAYPSRSQSLVNFGTPVVLRIWGYNDGTDQQQLLAQTVPIDHEFWYEYAFLLTPTDRTYNSLAIEAWYNNRKKKPYNGNVLLDKCSSITRIAQ